ncbi:MAG: DUF1349 domain-containing protein, partial [Bacteroidota bacterium]|nr:DUF1349 domain-containing protein [Bacteroidota bacterium]
MKKKITIGLLLAIFLIPVSLSQTVKIAAIPYTLHFENAPMDYKILGDNHLSITAPENTDLFISPDGYYKINKSPRLIFRPDSDFILTAKITVDFHTKWDAGVLMLYNDPQHFVKFCLEKDFKGQIRVVSVVCNETADDCNSMPVDTNEVYYRIIGSTKNKSFGLFYSLDNQSWFPIRNFKLDRIDNL